jgi:hypothetical protein
VKNVDSEDPRNNTERPYISASNAHGLVINHLEQKADTLACLRYPFSMFSLQISVNFRRKNEILIFKFQ